MKKCRKCQQPVAGGRNEHPRGKCLHGENKSRVVHFPPQEKAEDRMRPAWQQKRPIAETGRKARGRSER